MNIKQNYFKLEEFTNKFFNSDIYILLLAAITFTGWYTGAWVYTLLAMLALTIIMFIFCKNTISVFAFFWFFLLSVSANGMELQNFGWLIYLCVVLVAAIIFNIIRFKPDFKEVLSFKKIKSSTLSMILLIIPMSLGGLFYTPRNVIGALVVVALFLALAFAFIYFMAVSHKFIKDKDYVMKYIIKLMFMAGLIIASEIIITYLRVGDYTAIKTYVMRKSLNLGWGTPNPVGAAIALSMPAGFYFMRKKSKFAFLFVLVAFIEYVLLVSTGSRGALLFTTIGLPVIGIITFIKFKNKLQLSLMFVLIITGIVVIFVKYHAEIMEILNKMLKKGIDDAGRFDIYLYGWEVFKQNPLFGAGWDFGLGEQHVSYSPYLFHSTVIQIMACAGIVGIIIYLYFYWARYSTFFKKRTFESLIILAGMLIFEAYGMIDPVLFFPPTFFIQLMIMSFAVEQAMPDNMCRPFIFKAIKV